MTTRKRKGDEEFAEGLELDGFVMAGTPAAFEALPPGEAAGPRCVRCGAPISYVFLTSKGPMGGDCLATLTGDQSTRRLGRKLNTKLDQVMGYRERVTAIKIAQPRRRSWGEVEGVVYAVSVNWDRYDSYSGLYGTHEDFLLTFKAEQLPVVTAMVAQAAENRGLQVKIEEPARPNPRRVKWEEAQSDLFMESGVNVTDEELIEKYYRSMLRQHGWGRFPPIHATWHTVTDQDIEDYEEALDGGYEHELPWSRPPTFDDIGAEYVAIEDGHHRAYAARRAGVPLHVRVFDEVR